MYIFLAWSHLDDGVGSETGSHARPWRTSRIYGWRIQEGHDTLVPIVTLLGLGSPYSRVTQALGDRHGHLRPLSAIQGDGSRWDTRPLSTPNF